MSFFGIAIMAKSPLPETLDALSYQQGPAQADYGAADYCADLGPWSLVWLDRPELPKEMSGRLLNLPEAWSLSAHDGAMAAELRWFKGGRQQWFLAHDGDPNARLRWKGSGPAGYGKLKQAAYAKQKSDPLVDHLFELLIDVLEWQTGLRWGPRPLPQGQAAYAVAAKSEPNRKTGLLARLLKR